MNQNSKKRTRIEDDVECNETTIRSIRPLWQLPVELASWASTYGNTALSVSALLKLLNEFGFNIPNDSRSLKSTPRGTSKLIRAVEPGHYIHIGIENGIKYVLRRHKVDVSKLSKICLDYDMDGVKITDSTTNVFWPIWVRIGPPYIGKPFLVGNYHSLIGEPKDSNSYTLDFVNELNKLTKVGVEVDGKRIAVRVGRFLGDTPGRCLILRTFKTNISNDQIVISREREKLFCEKCPKWFYVREKLDGHIRRIHEGLKGYKCETCGKEFNKLLTFRLHTDKFHSNKEIPIYKCDYDGCDKQYNLRQSLRWHVESFHLKIPIIKVNKNLICETCGKSFRSGFALKVHGYTHTKQFPFPCTRCPRTFESNYKLKVHTMKHLNIKNFVCPHCGLRKTTNKDLKIHLNVHSDEKKFKCKECPQAFNTYGSLNHHIRIHHKKVRPHQCSYCNQTFARKGTKIHHEMTHTGEKPYVCHCGHGFIQAVSLRLHMKVHANQSKSTRRKETETATSGLNL